MTAERVMNYETWLIQRNDLRHAKSIVQARAAVSTRQESHMARKPDRKKIEQEKMHIASIDAENARLYGRLQKIHKRANSGWNKSKLYDRLAPQFHRQLSMVRSLKLKNIEHRWNHDKRRLRGVTSFVKFSGKKTSGPNVIPQRPTGLAKARKYRRKHRLLVNDSSKSQGSKSKELEARRDPFVLNGAEVSVLVHRKPIDSSVWKLEYRKGTKVDMASPSSTGKGPTSKSSYCIVSCWSMRNHPNGHLRTHILEFS